MPPAARPVTPIKLNAKELLARTSPPYQKEPTAARPVTPARSATCRHPQPSAARPVTQTTTTLPSGARPVTCPRTRPPEAHTQPTAARPVTHTGPAGEQNWDIAGSGQLRDLGKPNPCRGPGSAFCLPVKVNRRPTTHYKFVTSRTSRQLETLPVTPPMPGTRDDNRTAGPCDPKA